MVSSMITPVTKNRVFRSQKGGHSKMTPLQKIAFLTPLPHMRPFVVIFSYLTPPMSSPKTCQNKSWYLYGVSHNRLNNKQMTLEENKQNI